VRSLAYRIEIDVRSIVISGDQNLTTEGFIEFAADADVDHLVLSHFMARSLRDRPVQIEQVRAHYQGELTLAEDLACVR